jgi:hypothetical protein
MKIYEIIQQNRLIEGPYINGKIVPRLPDGSPPRFLYRITSLEEYKNGIKRGIFIPRERTHASIHPLWQFAEPGNQNVLLTIQYDDTDGWQAKQTSDGVVAITYEPIDARKVKLVAFGTRDDLHRALNENFNAGSADGGVQVGNAGAETIIMKPPQRIRKEKPIPQISYGIKIGRVIIPTSSYNSDNDRGQVNKIEGG